MKFCCQWASVSVNTSKQFHTSHELLGLGMGLSLGQCEDTVKVMETYALLRGNSDINNAYLPH